MSAVSVVIVLTTLPTPDKAAEIARILVEENLAACVSIAPVRSIYRWQGAVQDDTEALAIAKTTAERSDALRARIIELHPYEVPEVLILPASGGHAPYLAWVAAAVTV